MQMLYPPTEKLEVPQRSNQSKILTSPIQQSTPTRLHPPTPTAGPCEGIRMLLPCTDVTDANFDDAYVSFIFHCNPSVAADTDSTELRKVFRAPPKSDGKSFSTFTLYELIGKLERKELKTWAQLAIELGVEQPVIEKGQSAQKVQQYAVRLKVRINFLLPPIPNIPPCFLRCFRFVHLEHGIPTIITVTS